MNEKQGVRLSADYHETINAPISMVFPLLCPVEELKWIDTWKYNMVYSESGKNEKHCVFSENMTAPHLCGAGCRNTTYWITTRFEIENRIAHFVLVQENTIATLEIELKGPADAVDISFKMTMTALNDEGGRILVGSAREGMKQMMVFLAASLKHYCEKGRMMKII